MKFTVEIGNTEKQMIYFGFNKFWGNIKISVNGKTVKRDLVMFSFDTVRSYEFEVGRKEIHQIRIEKVRPVYLAGLRSNDYKVYVDGTLFKTFRD